MFPSPFKWKLNWIFQAQYVTYAKSKNYASDLNLWHTQLRAESRQNLFDPEEYTCGKKMFSHIGVGSGQTGILAVDPEIRHLSKTSSDILA